MKRLLALAFLLAACSVALSQSTVTVIGPVTPGNCTAFSSTTIIKDGGAPCGSGTGNVSSVIIAPGIAIDVSGTCTITTTGTCTIANAQNNYSHQYVDTGFSYTVPPDIGVVTFNNSSGPFPHALATGTLTLPVSPVDKQILIVSSIPTINSLTIVASGGSDGTLPTSIQGSTGFILQYQATDGAWVPLAQLPSSRVSFTIPGSGGSLSIADGISRVIFGLAGATATTFTITMPPSPTNGQQIDITDDQQITALTISPNTGQTVNLPPTSLNAGGHILATYCDTTACKNGGNPKWYFGYGSPVAAYPGGTTQFLRADNTFAVPPGSGGTVTSFTIAPGNGILATGTCTITTGGTCTIADDIATNTNFWAGTANKIVDAHVAQASLAVTALTVSTTTFTTDLSLGLNFSVTLLTSSCSCTMASPTNVFAGASGFIELIQPASGGPATITSWGGNWKFAGGVKPTLSTGANAKDIIPYFCDATNFCMVGAIQLAFQ